MSIPQFRGIYKILKIISANQVLPFGEDLGEALKIQEMRKIYINVFSALLLLLTISACKKELTLKVGGTSALTIVNGVVGNSYLLFNFNGISLPGVPVSGLPISFGNFYFSNSYSGQLKLALYQASDTILSSQLVYNLSLNLPVNTIHSLFLMGTTSQPDQLFTTDVLPFHPSADSVVSVRFVNLSQNNTHIDINIQGNAIGSETTALAYKGVAEFKNYAASFAVNSYIFEFRDHGTGQLLGNYTLDGINAPGSPQTPNIRRFRNFTQVFLDSSGGGAVNRILLVDENVQQ
jgi:hypothetical protein